MDQRTLGEGRFSWMNSHSDYEWWSRLEGLNGLLLLSIVPKVMVRSLTTPS